MKVPPYAFLSACRYEFLMQVRRPAVWILVGVTGLLLAGLYLIPSPGDPASVIAAERTQLFTLFFPLVLGILLADRLPRDRRLQTGELLTTLPTSLGSRLWGKYLGTVAATAIPILLVYLAEMAFVSIVRLDGTILLLELPAFALITLPGLLFVGAFSIVCTEILPPVLYSILFIGYWFWATSVPPNRIPTFNCTLLTPDGLYARVLLGGDPPPDCSAFHIMAAQAWENIALLLGLAFLAMIIGQTCIHWRSTHQ